MESRYGSAINYNDAKVLKDIYKRSLKENVVVTMLDCFHNGVITITGNYKDDNMTVSGIVKSTMETAIDNLKRSNTSLILIDICASGIALLDKLIMDDELKRIPIIYFYPTSKFISESLVNLRYAIREKRVNLLNGEVPDITYSVDKNGMVNLATTAEWVAGLAEMLHIL